MFKNNKNYILFLTCLFVFTIPLKENWSSIILIILILYSLYIWLNNTKTRIKYSINNLKLTIFFLIIISIIVSVISLSTNSISPETKFNRLSFYTLFFSFLVLFNLKIFESISIRFLVFSLFFGLLVSGLLRIGFGFYDLFFHHKNFIPSVQQIPYEDYISTHTIEYGVFLNFCWAWFLIEFFEKKLKLKLLIGLGILIGLLILTNFALSGFILFFIVSLIVFLFYNFRFYYKISIIGVIVFSLFSFLFLLTPSGKVLLVKVEGEASRVRNYETSIEIIKTLPLFGYGVGNELNILQKKRHVDSWEFINKYNAHNQYFEILIGGGWINLLMFVMTISITLFYAFKEQNILLLSFIVIISITMFIESLLAVHKGFLFVSYFWAYLFFNRDND